MFSKKITKCASCGFDRLERKYITWSTNGNTVEKIKCKKCKEEMWRTHLPKDEIKIALSIIAKNKEKKEQQFEFNF